MNRVRALAFDVFGTTVLRREKMLDPYVGLFADCGRTITKDVRHRLLMEPLDFTDTIDAFALNNVPRAQLLDNAEMRFKQDAAQYQRADGLDALLAEAQTLGLGTILISNLGLRYGAVVKACIPDIADKILSYDVGMIKPDPHIFTLAAKKMGVAPGDMVMVGDKYPNDVMGARTARYAHALWVAPGKPGGLGGMADVMPALKKRGLVP
jgi:HAD superfamily hydrolase (TIGR01549 family)